MRGQECFASGRLSLSATAVRSAIASRGGEIESKPMTPCQGGVVVNRLFSNGEWATKFHTQFLRLDCMI